MFLIIGRPLYIFLIYKKAPVYVPRRPLYMFLTRTLAGAAAAPPGDADPGPRSCLSDSGDTAPCRMAGVNLHKT